MRTTPELKRQRSTLKSLYRMRTDVILGSPSANCSGVGICRVMAYGEERPSEWTCPLVSAWMSVTENSKLRFEFEKSNLNKSVLKAHFRWMLFQVVEPYVVPYSLLPGKRIAERTIRPGVYQVWDAGQHLVVEF